MRIRCDHNIRELMTKCYVEQAVYFPQARWFGCTDQLEISKWASTLTFHTEHTLRLTSSNCNAAEIMQCVRSKTGPVQQHWAIYFPFEIKKREKLQLITTRIYLLSHFMPCFINCRNRSSRECMTFFVCVQCNLFCNKWWWWRWWWITTTHTGTFY